MKKRKVRATSRHAMSAFALSDLRLDISSHAHEFKCCGLVHSREHFAHGLQRFYSILLVAVVSGLIPWAYGPGGIF